MPSPPSARAWSRPRCPTGKRGKAGGIRPADSAADAAAAAEAILAMSIAGHRVEKVLVEARAEISREFYLAVVPDAAARCPAIMFSTAGGVDVEEIAADQPGSLVQRPVGLTRPSGRRKPARCCRRWR
jgi:succinyl-CoA synthetase beta subunit